MQMCRLIKMAMAQQTLPEPGTLCHCRHVAPRRVGVERGDGAADLGADTGICYLAMGAADGGGDTRRILVAVK